MITALILLDPTAAARAERDVVLVFIDPPFELLLHGLFTGYALAMPGSTALETDFSGTGRASKLGRFHICSSDMSVTVGFSAPADKGICIESFLALEPLILYKEIRKALIS